MAGPSKGSLALVPREGMRTLFFNNTMSDYAAKAALPGSEQTNFFALREKRLRREQSSQGQGRSQSAAAGAVRRRGGVAHRAAAAASLGSGEGEGSDVAPSFASAALPVGAVGRPKAGSQPFKWDGLTLYSRSYDEKTLEGVGIDREVALGLRQLNQGQKQMKLKGSFQSCYGALCVDRVRGSPSKTSADIAEENGLRELISPSANSIGTPPSFASLQHGPPPRGVLAPCTLQIPREEIGRVHKAADFFESEAQREFGFSASLLSPTAAASWRTAAPAASQRSLCRAASAPGGPAGRRGHREGREEEAGGEDLDRRFRRLMMVTQYGHTFSPK